MLEFLQVPLALLALVLIGRRVRPIPFPIFAAAAFLCASPQVHDGDSIRCGGERIRIANIDAPELPDSPKCQDRRRSYAWCDFAAGYKARNALRAFLSRGG